MTSDDQIEAACFSAGFRTDVFNITQRADKEAALELLQRCARILHAGFRVEFVAQPAQRDQRMWGRR